MPFQIADIMALNYSEQYCLRRQIEFTFLSEYKRYAVDEEAANKLLLIDLARVIDTMPTNGAFSPESWHKVCVQLGFCANNLVFPESLDCFSKIFKTYAFQLRALITRVVRAVENVMLTWGNPNNSVPDPVMITLLYLAWIFPLIRLTANLLSISKYVLGFIGTESEKALPWQMRVEDQLKRFWPELSIDILWTGLRLTGCFAFSLPTPPALSAGLFGSRLLLETVVTLDYQRVYADLEGLELNALILKDRMMTMGIWTAYFLGAACGLINQLGLAIGSLWVAVTCFVHIGWELGIRKSPMTLTVASNDDAVTLVTTEAIRADLPQDPDMLGNRL